jgi:hypothetical protein
MIYFSEFGVPTPTTDVVFAVQDFVSGTSTGAQTFTSPTITGVTPKGVMILSPYQRVSDEPAESPIMQCVVGFVQGTNDVNGRAFSRDGVADTSALNSFSNNQAISGFGPTGTGAKSASGQTASGGVELNYTINTDNTRNVFTAFAGADCSAFVGSKDLGTGTTAQDINTVGFLPDVVLAVFPCAPTSGTAANDMHYSFGIVTYEGATYPQRCVVWTEDIGQPTGEPYMSLLTTRGGARISQSNGTLVHDLLFNDFDSSGFSITCNASAASGDVVYMALKFTWRQVKLVDFDTPTTTGSHSITGAGFTPRYALIVITNLEVVDDTASRATSDNQGGFSISTVASDEQWSASYRIDAGATTTDTGNQLTAGVIGPSATDCDAIAATFSAWTSDGVTLSYTAVQGNAKKGFVLFVE